METKHKIRKIIATVLGSVLLGSTMIGAVASNLESYPAPFIEDGEWNSLLVVGDKAAASDVVGAIDIGVNLQGQATKPYEVDSTVTTLLEGDLRQISKGSTQLEIGTPIGDVLSTVTDSDLDLLKDGTLRSRREDGEYTQKIKFPKGIEAGLTVVYDKDDDDELKDYLFIKEDDEIFTYEMFFTDPVRSDKEGNHLEDIEDEEIEILGTTYTISKATIDNDDVTLTLMGGHESEVMEEGETKTITLNDVDYKVYVMAISDGQSSVKFTVNGLTTRKLYAGDTYTLEDDTILGVKEVIPNEAGDPTEDTVEFYLGANKLVLDNNQELEVNGNDIDGSNVIISVTNGNTVAINSITITVTAEDDLYIEDGETLSSHLDEGSLITANWDILYNGLADEDVTKIELDPESSNTRYVLKFNNINGEKIKLPLAYNDVTLKLGKDENENLILVEKKAIGEGDYFLVSDGDETKAFQLRDIDFDDEEVTNIELKDLGTGNNFDNHVDDEGKGTILNTWDFTIIDDELVITDMNNDEGSKAIITTEYEGILTIDMPDDDVIVTLIDDDGKKITTTLVINLNGADEIKIGNVDLGLDIEFQSEDDIDTGYTKYGTFVKVNDNEDLTILYPKNQLEPEVYVVSGEVTSTTETETDTKGVIINTIDDGIARLASEITLPGEDNLILIGGPCANELVGPITGITCDNWELPEGQALIQLFENQDKVAILVAGTTAADTRMAVNALVKNGITGTKTIINSDGTIITDTD